MAAQGALTEQDVGELRDAATAGRPGTVWFTAAAVGVPAGRSAKVVSVAEPAEGDFIEVRPAGSRDTVFCSPAELSRIRPARRRTEPPAPAEPPTPAGPSRARATRAARGTGSAPTGTAPPGPGVPGPGTHGPAPTDPEPADPAPAGPVASGRPAEPASPAPAGAPPAASSPAASSPAASSPAASSPAAPPAAASPPARPAAAAPPARAGRRAETATSVRLTATPDGEWQAEVFSGARRVGRAVPVPAADIAVAARALPPAVAQAVNAALEGARQRQLERVERLRAELDAAQRALDQLAG